jgi:hypothetical protein
MQTSNWGDRFSHVAMKDLARFLTTYNMVSQTVAVDGVNVYNVQTTGGGDCTINGVYIPALTADAELLINTEQPAPTAAWATRTTYSVDDLVYTGVLQAETQKFWKCLQAHNSEDSLTPAGNLNPTLWQAMPDLDEMELLDDFRMKIMITAEADGTMGLWSASAHSAIGTEPTLKIPYFDPSVYVVIGIIDYANDAASATVTFGESGGGSDFGTDGTFIDVIGPVFPHPDNMPKN